MNDNQPKMHPLDPIVIGSDGLTARLANALNEGFAQAEVWNVLRDCRRVASGRGDWAA